MAIKPATDKKKDLILLYIWDRLKRQSLFIFNVTIMVCTKEIVLIFSFLILAMKVEAQDSLSDKAERLEGEGKYEESIAVYSAIIKKDSLSKNFKELCHDYLNISYPYQNLGKNEISLQYLFKALKLAERNRFKKEEGIVNYAVARNYILINENENSLQFVEKAIIIFEEIKSWKELASSYQLKAHLLGAAGNYDKAQEVNQKALRIFAEMNFKEGIANTYSDMAALELQRENYKMVSDYSRKSLLVFKEIDDGKGIAASYINIVAALFNEHEKAINKGQLQQCISLLDSAYFAVAKYNDPAYLLKIYSNKVGAYERFNMDSAFFYQKKYQLLNDSIYSLEKDKQIEELKIQYQADKKEKEAALLAKRNLELSADARQRKLTTIIVIIIGALIACLSILAAVMNNFRRKKKELELEKNALELEQKALRAQMNPHFIFNAISSIQKYILKEDKQKAYDYLAKFAKLIRTVLNNSQEKKLPLSQELDMIDLYVELEQLRFKNSFDFEVNISKDVKEYDTAVPAMLIQPYVENAIWHGLMNLENLRKGRLNIDIKKENESLKIIITDNGVGREKAREYKRNDGHKSVGMALTEQRLLMINKMEEYEHARVVITDLYDEHKIAVGTQVEISLPIDGK